MLAKLLFALLLAITVAAYDITLQAAHYRDYFYVGGTFLPSDTFNGTILRNQMYVEHMYPVAGTSHPFPLVFIHGKSMTGTNFLHTAEGKPGWASYFLNLGYEVYIVDQAARARSAWDPTDGNMTVLPTEYVEQHFTAVEKHALWPQAVNHTQWPGSGEKGDGFFDAFYASTVQFLSADLQTELKMQSATIALLDRIGPAVVITHSQGGPFGWPLAQARPELVKGLVSLEPAGPPFHEVIFTNVSARAWGVTNIPMEYEPSIESPDELEIEEHAPEKVDLIGCLLQKKPAKKWSGSIRSVPMVVMTSPASYHATYDQCTVEFVRQAGVEKVDFIRLDEVGIFGNAHMFFLEKNADDIAAVMQKWIEGNVEQKF